MPNESDDDFRPMSPDEQLLWLESLAVRQGVTHGLTTSADMELEPIEDMSTEVPEDEIITQVDAFYINPQPVAYSDETHKAIEEMEKRLAERIKHENRTWHGRFRIWRKKQKQFWGFVFDTIKDYACFLLRKKD